MTISSTQFSLSAGGSPPPGRCASPRPVPGLKTPSGLLMRLSKHPSAPRTIIQIRAAMQLEARFREALTAREEDDVALAPLTRTTSVSSSLRALGQSSRGPMPATPPRASGAQTARVDISPPIARPRLISNPLALGSMPVLAPKRRAPPPLGNDENANARAGCLREVQSEGRCRSARRLTEWAESFCARPQAHAAACKLALYLLPRLEFFNLKRFHFPADLTLGPGFEGLESLPPRLTVYGTLRLEHLPNFKHFGRKIHVHGDLVLTELPQLAYFPACLTLRGGLRLATCAGLEERTDDLAPFEVF